MANSEFRLCGHSSCECNIKTTVDISNHSFHLFMKWSFFCSVGIRLVIEKWESTVRLCHPSLETLDIDCCKQLILDVEYWSIRTPYTVKTQLKRLDGQADWFRVIQSGLESKLGYNVYIVMSTLSVKYYDMIIDLDFFEVKPIANCCEAFSAVSNIFEFCW